MPESLGLQNQTSFSQVSSTDIRSCDFSTARSKDILERKSNNFQMRKHFSSTVAQALVVGTVVTTMLSSRYSLRVC